MNGLWEIQVLSFYDHDYSINSTSMLWYTRHHSKRLGVGGEEATGIEWFPKINIIQSLPFRSRTKQFGLDHNTILAHNAILLTSGQVK